LIRDSDLQVIVSNNLIADNGDNGMDLKRLPNVRIQNNIIRGNILSGIDICACNATVTENTIINNETGLYLFSESVAAVLNNKINDNKTNGLEMRPGVQLTALEGNEVMNNGEIGALLCCLESISMPNITFSEVNMKNKVVNNHKENIVIEVIDNTKSLPEKPLWAREYTQPSTLLSLKQWCCLQSLICERYGRLISLKCVSVYKLATYDVEEAIRKGLCTFTRTGHHFHQQYWWRCITCELSVHEGVCLVCKEKCHKGHQFVTQQPNFSGFYCDCGSSRPCQALK
jgi:nitrous oxidase accessory protein NosD